MVWPRLADNTFYSPDFAVQAAPKKAGGGWTIEEF